MVVQNNKKNDDPLPLNEFLKEWFWTLVWLFVFILFFGFATACYAIAFELIVL